MRSHTRWNVSACWNEPVEDGHFGHETAQTRQAQVGQTGNHVADGEERHDFHQTVQLTDITGVCTSVDHTDQGEEQGCHQPWDNICRTAPVLAVVFIIRMAMSTRPQWDTEE